MFVAGDLQMLENSALGTHGQRLMCGVWLQVAILFVFDLTRIATLKNLRNWYTQARVLNKVEPQQFVPVASFLYRLLHRLPTPS